MEITNNDRFVLTIDGLTERDENHYAIIWGGAYYGIII